MPAPEWLNKDALSSDPELRQLQLVWFSDDIWMRRVLFAATILGSITAVGALAVIAIVQPPLPTKVASGVIALISTLAAYLAGRRRQTLNARAPAP